MILKCNFGIGMAHICERRVLDQSGILDIGILVIFPGILDIASPKLGYCDIHREIGILAMRKVRYCKTLKFREHLIFANFREGVPKGVG